MAEEEEIRTEDRVRYTITDGIADVRMVRADKMNALDNAMFEALVTVGQELAKNNSVRVVVLSGEGRAFCAGLDFSSFNTMASGEQRRPRKTFETDGPAKSTGQLAPYVWTEMPVPVIAAVHGFALGGGLQIAIAADIRFATPDAKLSLMEVKWGLIPDMSGTQLLAGLIGRDKAKELIYTAKIIDGEEAGRIGLVTHVVDDPHAEAMKLAKVIAGQSPHAIRQAKILTEISGRVSLEEGFAQEQTSIKSLSGTPNQREAVRAGLEKTQPTFEDVS